MVGLAEWYAQHAGTIRLYCYYIILFFFFVSSSYEMSQGSKTIAYILFSFCLLMVSSVLFLLTRDPLLVLYMTTPASVLLAASVVLHVYLKMRHLLPKIPKRGKS